MRLDKLRAQELREKLIEYYKQYIGLFIFLRKNDNVKCKGVFKEFAPDGKLRISGDYKETLVDPLDIREFSARPDKKQKGDNPGT